MRTRALGVLSIVMVIAAAQADAAEHPSLAKARALYNAADFDAAIAAATIARGDPASADAAALVVGRSHLERYRLRTSDPADLAAGREALGAVRMAALLPRDQIDLLVGLGQALFLADAFGAAAELFDVALSRASSLPDRDRFLLLDWWASAIDREAQALGAEQGAMLLERVVARAEDALREDPGHPAANYWLVVASRGAGDPARAWHAAVAAWVRAPLRPESAAGMREDIDQFVTTVLIPERARTRPAREQPAAVNELRDDWEAVKRDWP